MNSRSSENRTIYVRLSSRRLYLKYSFFFDYDEFLKRLRIMFETNVIICRNASHTYHDEIFEFARFVCHLFLNNILQFFCQIQDKIRQFRTHNVLNSF